MRAFAGMALAALLGGCAALMAEAPLFPPGGEYGPAPLEAGVWTMLDDNCSEAQARRRRPPQDCYEVELRALEDGSWRVPFTIEDDEAPPGGVRHIVLRAVFAPAVENALPDVYAPIYLAELQQMEPEPETNVSYAVVAPLGVKPARDMLVLAEIGCDAIFRGGPIEGVRDERTRAGVETTEEERAALEGEPPRARGASEGRCVAETQAGAREAARRAVIENISDLAAQRMIWVRALP